MPSNGPPPTAPRPCLDQAAELAQEAFALIPPGQPAVVWHRPETVARLVRGQSRERHVATADRLIAGTKNNDAVARLEVQVCRGTVVDRCAKPRGRAAGRLHAEVE